MRRVPDRRGGRPARQAGPAARRRAPRRDAAGGPKPSRRPTASATRVSARRSVVFLGAVMVVMVAIVGRLTQVQAVSASVYAQKGSDQRVRHITLAAERGSVFDRNGVDLAVSVAQQTVWANPRVVGSQAPGYAAKLAPVLGMDAKVLTERLSKTRKGPDGSPERPAFVYLARKVDEATAEAVRKLDLPGVDFVPESKRFYPAGSVAAPLLGNVGLDNQGLAGLEVAYERSLAGRPGELVVEQAPGGFRIPQASSDLRPALRGSDLVLTVNQSIQYELEQALVEAVKGVSAKGGLAVIAEVATGEILAMANVTGDEAGGARPSNPGENNRAVTDVYEPGSTNKVITMAGAIEEGLVTPETRMTVPDKLAVGDHIFSDHAPHAPTDWSITDIFAQSSNVGTIMTAQKLGKDRLDHFMRAFGYGKRTGIGFPGEATGLVIDPEDYWITTMGSVPIGSSVAVTALQMLQVYATIGNGGVWQAPKLVQATIDADGQRRARAQGESHRVVSVATAAKLNQMLRTVVTDGTGSKAAIPGYTVGGKTGTARKPKVGGLGYEGYVASFAGFVPAEDPRLAAVVVIDEPKGLLIYGGQVAAPVFSRVMQYALRAMRIPPPAAGPAAVVGAAPTTPGTPPVPRAPAPATTAPPAPTAPAPPAVAPAPPAVAPAPPSPPRAPGR